ncbi:MAG: helix-turn-helix domain-containing protein [Anaeroplasma sp.]
MGRKTKYSKELKIEIVKKYLKGESISHLANIYNIPNNHCSPILTWVRQYEALGDSVFNESSTNKSYSKELKEKIVKEYLAGKDSFGELANKYNIRSKSIVIKWVKKYNEGIEIKDYDPKGDVYTMKSRKTTFEERLEIVNYALTNSVKEAADKYTVPYMSVYQWVSKYNERGENGLTDRRGRPSSNVPGKELTLDEKQAMEIEKLKNELKRKDMVIEVLKKNIEIQERMERDSRLLNKRTNTKR